MDRVIYFVEDQEALTSYILLARAEERFPGWRILASDNIDQAIEWCRESDAQSVFVVDSRMISETLSENLEQALKSQEGQFRALDHLLDNDLLTGALGTVVLKWLKPDCRIILLTAFYRTLASLRLEHLVLNELLNESVDMSLPKTSPEDLSKAIESQINTFGPLDTEREKTNS